MNPSSSFNLLLAASGMTRGEASTYLNVTANSMDNWIRGRYNAPQGVLSEMAKLISIQGEISCKTINQITDLTKLHGMPDDIELGFPADNYEAGQLGFPCVNAWLAMAGRVVAWCECQEPVIAVNLVPRGSTPATAAAIGARERNIKNK